MYEQIRYEVDDAIATLTLNRPDRLNAWTERMGVEIRHALAAAERDPEVVVIVITGAGRGFCAGADMGVLAALSAGDSVFHEQTTGFEADPGDASMGPSFRGPFSYPMSIAKPLIAAINGPCVGMALPIVLACDVRIASDRASFSTAFARRGLIAEWGVSWMLPRVVGLAHALDLLLTARKVEAAEAARIGLVSQVVPHDELHSRVREYALDIARNCSPRSLAAIKRQMLRHTTASLHEAEQEAMQEMMAAFAGEDFREGLASFAEKRPPRFRRLGATEPSR